MPEVGSARLPVPHLFMVVSIGSFALMMVSAFAPAAADGGGSSGSASGAATAATVVPATGCTGGPTVTVGDPSCAADMAMAGTVGPAAPALDGLTVGSLVALLTLLVVTVRAGRMGAHGSGRPIVGLTAGLLAGLAGATTLFSVGAITLSSPAWIYVPMALATLGTALGTTAPLPRR